MRKVFILLAGGALGFFVKNLIDEMKSPLTVTATTGQQGQRVPPFVFETQDEEEPVKPDADF